MTGWRCGWTHRARGARSLRSTRIQSHATSNVSSITQKAVIAALTGPQEPVTTMLDEYRKRRDRLHEWLTADPRLQCDKPAGAFYLFADVGDVLVARTASRRLDRFRRRRCSTRPESRSRRARRSMRPASSGCRTRRRWRISARAAAGSSSSRETVAAGSLGDTDTSDSLNALKRRWPSSAPSGDRRKFGNRAVRAFREQGYTVIPINPHER